MTELNVVNCKLWKENNKKKPKNQKQKEPLNSSVNFMILYFTIGCHIQRWNLPNKRVEMFNTIQSSTSTSVVVAVADIANGINFWHKDFQ